MSGAQNGPRGTLGPPHPPDLHPRLRVFAPYCGERCTSVPSSTRLTIRAGASGYYLDRHADWMREIRFDFGTAVDVCSNVNCTVTTRKRSLVRRARMRRVNADGKVSVLYPEPGSYTIKVSMRTLKGARAATTWRLQVTDLPGE